MVGAEQLEKSILEAIVRVRRDGWADLSIGGLRTLVAQAAGTDAANAAFSNTELSDALVSLVKRGLILFEKSVGAGKYLSYEQLETIDQLDDSAIFHQGSFRLKLTHEGRKAVDVSDTPPHSLSENELDVLLPLRHRKAFDQDLEPLAEVAMRDGYPLAFVMIDLDRFKMINDTYGHSIGDGVLQGVANVILTCVKGKGKAYRFGGEELVILLPNFSTQEAAALAESIRARVESEAFTEKQLKATVSAGVAVLPDHAQDGKSLLNRADKAMYQAKKLGRNLIRISGENEPLVLKPFEIERRQPESVPHADEIRRHVEDGFSQLSEAEKEAMRLLVIYGQITDRHAIELVRRKGLIKDNPTHIFVGIESKTGFIQRMWPWNKSEMVHGYQGPWTLNEHLKPILEGYLFPEKHK